MHPRVTTEARTHIRSFALRKGQMSPAQQRAYDSGLPVFGIAFQAQVIDWVSAFGREAPLILEIGFGMGETSAAIAQARAEDNFIGCEVHTPGVGALLKRLQEAQVRNVRVVQHDAVEVLRDMIAPASLSGIHLYFPDPWPKKRHHKRRLVQPDLVALMANRLKPGAYVHMATDWEEYAQHMLTVLQDEPALRNAADTFAQRPSWRPQTKFETRGLKLGHGIRDLMFIKLSQPNSPILPKP